MEFSTQGVNYYPDYICHLYVTHDIETLSHNTAKEYYKIIYVESGVNHISINKNEFILIGAYALYINEIDDIIFTETPKTDITILYFKPSVINDKFDFQICNSQIRLSLSDWQDIQFLSKFKHTVAIENKMISLNPIDSSTVLEKLQQIREKLMMQESSFWPCRSRACLFEILFLLTQPEENTKTICPTRILTSFSKLTIEVINFLQSNYHEKITVQKLAQLFCTNRTTLLTDFKKSTNLSVNQYLTELRIKIAVTLLRDTELTVNEISERTGFSDMSYFCKAFKKATSYSPSEYRSMNRYF